MVRNSFEIKRNLDGVQGFLYDEYGNDILDTVEEVILLKTGFEIRLGPGNRFTNSGGV